MEVTDPLQIKNFPRRKSESYLISSNNKYTLPYDREKLNNTFKM